MREVFGYQIKDISDKAHKELLPDEVYNIFKESYVNIVSPLEITETHFVKTNGIEANVSMIYNGKTASANNIGNGRIDAVSNAVKSYTGFDYKIETYEEHALENGSSAEAVSYVEISDENNNRFWGTGIDTDIVTSSIKALISAVNVMVNSDK